MMGKILFIVVILLLIGTYSIYKSNNTDLSSLGSTGSFIGDLANWFFQLGKSTSNTVGYAVHQEWLPELNNTNSTNKSISK